MQRANMRKLSTIDAYYIPTYEDTRNERPDRFPPGVTYVHDFRISSQKPTSNFSNLPDFLKPKKCGIIKTQKVDLPKTKPGKGRLVGIPGYTGFIPGKKFCIGKSYVYCARGPGSEPDRKALDESPKTSCV